MKRDDKEIVQFGFVMKNYYRDSLDVRGQNIYTFKHKLSCIKDDEHEVKGTKTLKLFKSWFRLAKKTGRLLYGVVKFSDGTSFIWQNPNRVYHGGWQKAYDPNSPKQLSLDFS